YVAVNIEAFGFGMGKGVAIAPPDQAMSASVYSWRDYGNRVGVWRLFDLFDELNLPIEAQMNVEVYEAAPDIPERLRKRGDQFDELLRQSARQSLVCPISLHPFVMGRPYRLPQLRRALEHIARHRDRIWLTRPGEICAHVERLPRGVVPGSA